MGYKVDLKNFMARCETNYVRLCQIFPSMAEESDRRLGLTSDHRREVLLSVKERTPYTTLLTIVERTTVSLDVGDGIDSNPLPVWCRAPVLSVRLYHDASLAEVVGCDEARGVHPNNPYPNRQMLQRDEKAQWNKFLEEWLVVCVKHGYVLEPDRELVNSDV